MADGWSVHRQDKWLVIPGRVVDEPGNIFLNERASSDVTQIVRQLRDNCYEKPFVIDDGEARRLHFSLDYVQSEMLLRDPYELRFAYAREMMASLLFVPKPREIVLVGLGGGSLTRFCYRQLPSAHITTIEIDAKVIALRELFEIPRDGQRLQIVHADAVTYFAESESPTRADIVLIDGCDRQGVASAFCDVDFYRSVCQKMKPQGMLAMNLIGPARAVEAHLTHIAEAFGEPLIVRSLRRDGNRVVFAQKGGLQAPDWTALQRRAVALQREHGLDFPAFVRGLRRGRRIAPSGGDS